MKRALLVGTALLLGGCGEDPTDIVKQPEPQVEVAQQREDIRRQIAINVNISLGLGEKVSWSIELIDLMKSIITTVEGIVSDNSVNPPGYLEEIGVNMNALTAYKSEFLTNKTEFEEKAALLNYQLCGHWRLTEQESRELLLIIKILNDEELRQNKDIFPENIDGRITMNQLAKVYEVYAPQIGIMGIHIKEFNPDWIRATRGEFNSLNNNAEMCVHMIPDLTEFVRDRLKRDVENLNENELVRQPPKFIEDKASFISLSSEFNNEFFQGVLGDQEAQQILLIVKILGDKEFRENKEVFQQRRSRINMDQLERAYNLLAPKLDVQGSFNPDWIKAIRGDNNALHEIIEMYAFTVPGLPELIQDTLR
jgi:hypothetical protein